MALNLGFLGAVAILVDDCRWPVAPWLLGCFIPWPSRAHGPIAATQEGRTDSSYAGWRTASAAPESRLRRWRRASRRRFGHDTSRLSIFPASSDKSSAAA